LWRQWAPLPLRLVIGYGFIAHGWAKLSRGPAGFARLLDQIGAPLPEVTAWVSTLIEILGGLAILAGAFVAAVSVPLIVLMLVAMFTVHLRYGFSAINTIGLTADGPQFGPPGYEVKCPLISGCTRFSGFGEPAGFWGLRNGCLPRSCFWGFWNKKAGILGALGCCFAMIGTVTIIPFMPDGWAASAGGFPAMQGNVAFLMKDAGDLQPWKYHWLV
jgi:putative oxidoreductase